MAVTSLNYRGASDPGFILLSIALFLFVSAFLSFFLCFHLGSDWINRRRRVEVLEYSNLAGIVCVILQKSSGIQRQAVSCCSMLMCWFIGRKHELLLYINREVASDLNIEKTKYRLIPCHFKRRQENSEYTYGEGQQILIQFNSWTKVLLARYYATSRKVPNMERSCLIITWGTIRAYG